MMQSTYLEEDKITITTKEYNRLVRDSLFLSSLEAAGIDNTDAYSFGVEQFYEDNPEYDEDSDEYNPELN